MLLFERLIPADDLEQWFSTFLRPRTSWAPRIVNAYHFLENILLIAGGE